MLKLTYKDLNQQAKSSYSNICLQSYCSRTDTKMNTNYYLKKNKSKFKIES